MPITDLGDWSTTAIDNTDLNGIPLGEGLTAPSHVNGLFREMMAQLKTAIVLPCFVADKNNVDQTGIVSATKTLITFTNEWSDVGACYTAASSKWTPVAGVCLIQATVAFSGSILSGGTCFLQVYKNGLAHRTGEITYGANTGLTGASVHIIDEANGTDYYEIYGFVTTSSGTATATGANSHFTGAVLQRS